MDREELFTLQETHDEVPVAQRERFVSLVRWLDKKDKRRTGHVRFKDGQMIFELDIELDDTALKVEVQVRAVIGIFPFVGTFVRRFHPLPGEPHELLSIEVYEPGHWEKRLEPSVPVVDPATNPVPV